MMTKIQCLDVNDYKKLSFEVPGEVVGKGRPKFTVRGGYAKAYTPQKTADYERTIKLAYLRHNKYMSLKALKVKIYIYKGIPKSASKKDKSAMLEGRIMCAKKPDVDNVVKVVLDALNGVAYKDDTQVTQLALIRKYAVTDSLKVVIEEIGEIH